MRVLHFYKTYYPDTFGGVEQVICHLSKGMQNDGVSSQLLTLSKHSIEQPNFCNGCLVHRAYLNFQVASTGFSFSAFRKFRELITQVDLVHYHFPWPFMDLVHFASSVKVPTLVTYHSDIVKQKKLLMLYRPLMNQFLKRVNRIVVASPNYLATSEVLQCFKDKVSIVPMGLQPQVALPFDAELLQKWRLILPERFFLFVGVLRYYKGLHILLEASRHGAFPIVVVGSGPEESALKLQAKTLNLKNIYFLGALEDEDKRALLQLCYAFVFPSHLRSEAFGLSLVEAAMYAKPMISCEIGTGTTYVNLHHETGLVVEPNNPFALHEAMKQMWENPNLVGSLGKGAFERFNRLFTAEKMVAGYLDVYRELLS